MDLYVQLHDSRSTFGSIMYILVEERRSYTASHRHLIQFEMGQNEYCFLRFLRLYMGSILQRTELNRMDFVFLGS